MMRFSRKHIGVKRYVSGSCTGLVPGSISSLQHPLRFQIPALHKWGSPQEFPSIWVRGYKQKLSKLCAWEPLSQRHSRSISANPRCWSAQKRESPPYIAEIWGLSESRNMGFIGEQKYGVYRRAEIWGLSESRNMGFIGEQKYGVYRRAEIWGLSESRNTGFIGEHKYGVYQRAEIWGLSESINMGFIGEQKYGVYRRADWA